MATAERLLLLLDLLQSRTSWTGPALAERLGVSPRSIRRDIERLRELGYAVESDRGLDGGYRLVAGRGLPPLLLTDQEAVAVAVSLSLASTGPLTGASEAATRTLAKLDQMMPPRLRAEVSAIQSATATLGRTDAPVDGDALLTIARACRDHTLVRFDYLDRRRDTTQRSVEPVRLVATARRWYLMAWCTDREDWRTFRLDRMSQVTASTWRYRLRDHPEPVAYVQRSLTEADYRYQATVRFAAGATEIRSRLPETVARIEPEGPSSCLVHVSADDLSAMLPHLLWVGIDFEVIAPVELIEASAAMAARLSRAAGVDQS